VIDPELKIFEDEMNERLSNLAVHTPIPQDIEFPLSVQIIDQKNVEPWEVCDPKGNVICSCTDPDDAEWITRILNRWKDTQR
jgi:hypothetical protein